MKPKTNEVLDSKGQKRLEQLLKAASEHNNHFIFVAVNTGQHTEAMMAGSNVGINHVGCLVSNFPNQEMLQAAMIGEVMKGFNGGKPKKSKKKPTKKAKK
jgi:hypothetical protein